MLSRVLRNCIVFGTVSNESKVASIQIADEAGKTERFDEGDGKLS